MCEEGLWFPSPSGTDVWLSPLVVVGYLLSLPLWIWLASRNKHTKEVLYSGWTPVISAMMISRLVSLTFIFFVPSLSSLLLSTLSVLMLLPCFCCCYLWYCFAIILTTQCRYGEFNIFLPWKYTIKSITFPLTHDLYFLIQLTELDLALHAFHSFTTRK